MSDALAKHKKNCEEMQLAAMIWWLILWYASDEGKLEIPSEQEWLSCELVAAIIEEARGKKFHYSWRHNFDGTECDHLWNEWPDELNRMMQMIPSRREGPLEKKLHMLLKQFVAYRFACEHDEKWYESELKRYHQSHTPTRAGYPSFTPHASMHDKAVDELLRYTYVHHAEVCGWCRKIGTVMRPYIERDVAYIKSHYSW